MEVKIKEHVSQTEDLQQIADHETNFLEERAESNPGVRKSSRPRKQSKRVLDSVDCNDIELLGIPIKKKHRRDLKLKTGQKKDILPNGRPFKCSLCESPYINNSPAKAKIKSELQPIVKEKFGQLLQLCVKCAIAVNHTENKGPTPEQRAEFEEEGRQFAQHVVEYLKDSAAARLYCSFYQTTKCGCIQSYITGTPAGRKRKTSLSGGDCASSDTAEPKLEDAAVSVDDKVEQAQRARYLLGLLKESMAKKQIPNAKKSNEKLQQSTDDTASTMKESDRFILENRVKLKELGICERGCQKVLCYSNNFLHKKSVGSQPRLQRTRGRAALGRLHGLQVLHTMKCCEKYCVRLAERNQAKMALWRQRAQQGQKEMWKVLEEMLTATESGKTNCFKFISMVTGCCLTTVQKVYADVLLSKGAAGCVSKREHGMRFHWKRQKELGKRGHISTTALPGQPQGTDPRTIGQVPVGSDTCLVPTLITSQALMPQPASEVVVEPKPQCQQMEPIMSYGVGSSQAQPSSQLCGDNFEEKGDKEDFKEKVLKLLDNMKDPRDMQEILAKLERELLIKQEKRNASQGFASPASVHVSGTSVAASSSSSSSASTPLSVMLSSPYTPSCSSNASSEMMPHPAQDQHFSSIPTPKQGRPFVHIKVQPAAPDLKTPAPKTPQLFSRKQRVSSSDRNTFYHTLDASNSVRDPSAVDIYITKTEALSSQHVSQPLDLSNLTAHPGTPGLNAAPAGSLPVDSISSIVSPFVMEPHVSSMTDNSLDVPSQQVSLFQVMDHTGTDNSHLTTQPSQILSVYPQQATPLQIQPFPLLASNNAQHIQFQLVSPMVLGQSDLMIPLNQAGTMSFILPKQSTSDLHSNETFSLSLPLSYNSSIGNKDSIVSQVPTISQSFQNNPVSSQTLLTSIDISGSKFIPSFSSPTQCNLTFSRDSCNVSTSKQEQSVTSQSLAAHGMSGQMQSITFENASGAADNAASHHQTRQALKPQCSYSSANTPSITVMNLQDIHSTDTLHHVTNIDHYFPPSLLGQASGNIVVGTPSSYCSSSFVFDALADSPVKDSLKLSSPSLQVAPVVTSSLLCEMLMRSMAPSTSSISSTHMQDLAPALSTSTTACRSPTHFHGSQVVSSAKSSLLISALKSSPVSSSSYCQSMNFNTHTTPSTMSNQPMVMTGKVEQTSLPVATIHSSSLSHSPMAMSRLNRQREPPQVGIVHPHISGVKGGTGHASVPTNTCSNHTFNHNSAQTSSVPSSSMSHSHLLGDSLLPSSSIVAIDSTSLQRPASAQDVTSDHPAAAYSQQHLLLPLLLNPQKAASLTDQHVMNTAQLASQFNLTALLGNPVMNTSSASESLYQIQSSVTHNQTNTSDSNVNLQSSAPQGSQHGNRCNLLPHHIQMADQASVPIGGQNIILGSTNGQQPTDCSQFFQSVSASNGGHLQLIPVIFSGASGSSSAPNIFSQNGQLLVNMNSSPQNVNRDNSILLNMSPNSSQSLHRLHVVGSGQTTSLPSPSPNTQQNNHQNQEVNTSSKEEVHSLQFSVLPHSSGHEIQNTTCNNTESQLPTYSLSGPAVSGGELVHAYKRHKGESFSGSHLSSANTSIQILGKDTINSQPSPVLRRDSSSGHSVFSSSSPGTFATASSSEETPCKAAEVIGTRATNLSKSASTSRKMSSNLSQIEDAGSRNQAEGKHHVSLIQVPHSSAESSMQHQQLPFQVLNMVSTQEEQPSIDNVLSSDLSANVILSPSTFQSIGPGQQLHSLNIAGSNQIFLPIQSVPFNKQVGAGQTNQTQLQLGQQLNDLHTIFVPTLESLTANNLSPLVSVVEFTRSVNTSGTDSSAQASVGNTGLQHTSSSTSKHRPIRPKLLPVPAPAPKISLMLVPDKSGGATYHLTQLDPSVLSFQHVSEQKDKIFPQVQIVTQEPQNSSVLSGTPQQSPNTHFSRGTPHHHQNIIVVPMTSQHSQNTIYFPVTSQQSLNTLFAPETCKQQQTNPQEPQNAVTVPEPSHKQRPTVNTTIMSQLQLEQQQNKPAQILVLSEPHRREATTTSDKYICSKQQKQTLPYPSQQVNNFSIQALPVTDHRYKVLSQETGILSQQFTMQPNQTQMTLVSYETPEMSLLQSGDLKESPLHTGHFQILPSNNSKEFQIAFSQDRPVFIDALQSDSIPAETVHTFEVSNLQSSACEASMGQCSSIDGDASRSQATVSQMSSLPSGTFHNDIRRSNTQTASQLDGKHIEMVTQQHSRTKAPIGQYQLSVGSSSDSPTVQTTEAALKETHFPAMKGHDTRLDTTPTTTFLMQSKQAPVSYSVQQMANKDVGMVSQTATQASSNAPVAMSLSGQACGTPQGVAVYASLPSNIPVSNVCTTKQPTAVDVKNILSNSDVKPVVEPVQYLQCKEVIDLTNDSPPLSPSSQLLFRSKISGLYPTQGNQTQVSVSDDELFSLLHYEGQRSSHQSTAVIPVQLQRLFQQNLPPENQHVHHKLHPTKQDLEDVYKTLSEQENMVLMTSGSSPVTGHHEIQFESMTFSPDDNLVYCQASLPSKAPPRHTEDQQRCVTTEVDEQNKSQNFLRAVSLNQQPVAPARLQGAHVELIPTLSNCNRNKLTLITEDSVALSQATYRPSLNNLNSKLPSLSVVGIPVTNKPLMDLSAQGQSRCSSATGLFSEVTAAAPSDQRSSSVTSANQITPTLTKHMFHVATSSPTVQSTHLTTTLPSISSVRTSVGRKILHPLTSSTVAFVRTTNTPTDAVGPPNITIMSSAQASSSPLLRFHHDNSTVAASAAVINQTATTASSYSLPIETKAQSSGLLKLTNSTSSAFVPFRIQSSQDARDSTLLLYPNSGGRDQIVGHSARRLSLEQTPHANASKEVHAPETYSPSLASKPTDSQIKPAEPPAPSKPRSRKRQSTVMDLLRNKEKLQAAASNPVRSTNSTPGPVTLMISGAAGSSNLLVGDSSAGQPRVDPSALNITVKNIQLLAKLPSNTDKISASSSTPPSNQRSGFTILQPNILHSSFSRSSNAVSESAAVLKEVTTVSLSAMPSTSTLVDSHTSATNTASMPPTIYLPVQSVSARDSPFLANLSQTKLLPGHQDAFHQQVTLANQPFTSTRFSSCGNQEIEIFMSGLGQPSTSEPCRNISTGHTFLHFSDLRHKLPQEILKSEPGVHLPLINQPQEARSSYKVKPTTSDLVVQKPQSVQGDSSYGKVCKFKTSKSSSSDDCNQEVPSLKLQLLEDSHKKKLIESTGATKKFLLLSDKLPGSEAPIKQQLNPSSRPSLQLDHNAGQVSAEQKRLSLKSPQLLQLMKNKPQFSPSAVDQSVSSDKHHHLKLPTTSTGMPVSDDNAAYSCRPSSTVVDENYHISNKNSQQRDQNPALKMYPTSAEAQLRGIKSGIVGDREKYTAFEAGSDTRKSLLPSQNPLLANILFTSVSGGALNHLHSLSASKSTLYSDTETKVLFERRSSSSIEDKPHVNESITLVHQQASSKQLEDQLFGIRTDQLLKRPYEELLKSSPDYRSGPNKAPFKTASDCKSELRNAPPAYGQPPRNELAAKDMTRVSKVIEDIYKFPDEADESSPPPAFAGWKSQVEPQKFTFVPSGSSNRKSFDSAHECSTNNFPLATESAQYSTLSKSNIKPMPSTAQCTSAVQQGTKVYNLSESSPTWRNPKKLRHTKEFDKLSSKFGLKKVQFSDVITSKSTSEYGQSITVSSQIEAVPSEVPSNYPLDAQSSKSQEAAGVKHQHNFAPYLHGQHQNLTEDNQDNEVECVRHLCATEQFQVEPREYKFSKAEGATVHITEARDKASELAYIQREEDKISSPDFEAEDRHGRESHRVHLYQHIPKVSHRVPATAFVDYEHGSKRRDDDDTGLGQTLRHTDGSQYPFQGAFTQGNMEKLSSLLRDKPEAHRLHENQNDLRSPNQNVFMEALRGISKCDDMAQGKIEGSIRDLGKRKQLAHDESFQPNAGVHHMAERKHFMAAKKELPSLSDTAAGNSDRDSSFDQQSSFNILSSQGYSKLSRQRLSRAQSDQLWADNSQAPAKNAHFASEDASTGDTSCSSAHFQECRDSLQQTRCDSVPASNASSSDNADQQFSDSPLIRQTILENHFQLARQMKMERVQILTDSRSEDFEMRKPESPTFILYPERKLDGISNSLIHRGTESQIDKELEYRTLSDPDSVMTSPTFLTSLDGRPDVLLSSIESYSVLRNQIKGLKGVNHYLKQEVAKKEKEQQRQRQLSSSDRQKGILTETDKAEKMYYMSPCSSSQAYMVDADSVIPPRKRHSSSTAVLGMFNCSPLPGSEQNRPEEGFLNKPQPSTGIQQILESDSSFLDGHLRSNVSGFLYSRNMNSADDYSPPENYIKDTRDPLVSSSMGGHSRPSSHLELGIPQYESTRNRYTASELKPISSRGIFDGEGFVPLQEHTRHRNLSSSLGLRTLFEDPPPYDITQRHRNPSSSSLKSSFQDYELLNFDLGARSRNPSSSSWIRYDYTNDSNFTAVRSRNPSGSSNRRSRPGSSSSDRELPGIGDELPMFPDFARTRSRNSSGESIEPTVELFLDPQQFQQYTYQTSDAHIKRTKH